MRVSRADKEKTRERILAAAARQFRERGMAQVGVAEVMHAAGLTHGGFYRHFETKDDLAAAATTHAVAQLVSDTETGTPMTRAAFIDRYLSAAHAQAPGLGCPVATLGPEIARAGPPLRDSFADDLNRVIDLLATDRDGDPDDRRSAAITDLAAMVGTVILARLLGEAPARRLIDDARAHHGLPPHGS